MNDQRVFTNLDSVTVEAFGVNDERALRDEVAAREAAMHWDRLPGDARAAMASLVREALLQLADDVEAWLPQAAVAETNTSFGFFVWWKNRHLDEEIVRQRACADREDHERLMELKRIAGRSR